ncbi:Xaa-Pro dipeptidase [Thermocladium modestius]|uniref:Xaa-Pro dipeptidase n=1 Tax=Thermocladium modestius TaxID=62609 RepID=A0A830GV44_9CREN|nr:Xaa-Pro peptidase family protein [Thermocladium modestius]GGP19841.1 Xaa-Pro dipeptidase [Thermocladium modestius]
MWRLPDVEYRDRLERVRRRLSLDGIDALYLTSAPNIFYLTGYFMIQTERPLAVLISGKGNDVLFLGPMVEKGHVGFRSRVITEEHYYFDYPGEEEPMVFFRKVIAEAAGRLGLKVIGMDNPAGASGFWGYKGTDLSSLLKRDGLETRKVEGLVEEMRLIKSSAEVELIRESGRWAARAHEILLGKIRPGAYDWEVSLEASLEASREMKKALGDDYMPLTDSVPNFIGFRGQVGEYSAFPHALAAPRPIREDDVLGSGAGPDVGGYRSELERTIIVGNPAEAEKRFNAMMKLREAALNAMGPGVKVRDIDAAVRRTARELGLMDYLRHHVGHGLGIEGHEAPFLDIGYEGELRPGMVVSCEPGLYYPGHGGYRHSDTVLVTSNGIEILTRFPTEFDELRVFKR